jgi:hypothetical protein
MLSVIMLSDENNPSTLYVVTLPYDTQHNDIQYDNIQYNDA